MPATAIKIHDNRVGSASVIHSNWHLSLEAPYVILFEIVSRTAKRVIYPRSPVVSTSIANILCNF